MLTVLPDLYLIWKVQRQMVADIFALHGRAAELTRAHMLYCLFRHMASHVARDVVVRAGQRVIVQQLSAGAIASLLKTRRRLRHAARRRHRGEPLGARSPAPQPSAPTPTGTRMQVAKSTLPLARLVAARHVRSRGGAVLRS